MSTCKRDVVARDRDVWLSVRDETETEIFPHFAETETRPRRLKNTSRDRLETETASVACLNRFVFGPGRRVPNSYCSCSSSWSQIFKVPKNPKAFLICSGVQRQFAYTFMLTLPIDLPSQIFHLFSN